LKNNKKYDIDDLLKRALRKDETPPPELIQTVGARIARPQTPVGYAGIGTSVGRDFSDAPQNYKPVRKIKFSFNTVVAITITLIFITCTVFATFYLRVLNPDDVGAKIDKSEMKQLANTNPDVFAWITVSGTKIDYPVVQTKDNDFYLRFGYNKEESRSGAIFMDYRNSKNLSENRHTIFYGHNMLDRTMFSPLIKFSKNEELFKNGMIEIITNEAIYYYKIFSVHEEEPTSGYIRTNFYNDEDYVGFLTDMKSRSIFEKDVTLDADSKIITLSTCVNDIRVDRRFVVQGVLVDVEYS